METIAKQSKVGMLHIGITSCTFPPWAEMSKKNGYEIYSLDRVYMKSHVKLAEA